MVTKAADVFSLRIPARALARPVSSDCLGAGLWLADKLAELPYIESQPAIRESGVTLSLVSAQSIRRRAANVEFCQVYADRVLVSGLTADESSEVCDLGWGVLEGDRVMLHMPRDRQEADVCWQILHRAYLNKVSSVSRRPVAQRVMPVGLPQFSRSHLR